MTERRSALVTAAGLVMLAVLAIPFGAHRAGVVNSLLPTVDGASFVAMIASAALLRNHYLNSKFVPHAFLSVAFATTALLLIPYTIAFPGAFSPTGFGLGARVAAWLWVAWHAAFILLVGAYVWAESYFTRQAISERDAAHHVRTYVAVVGGVALAVVGLVVRFGNAMPVLLGPRGFSPFFHALVQELLIASAACVVLTLVARTFLRRTMDLWLGVVLVAFVVDLLVDGELVRAPFTVAWYLALVTNLSWQMTFLVAQLRSASARLAAYADDARTLVEATLRDELTGIYNRRAFNGFLGDAIGEARIRHAAVGLVVFELDQFRAFNEHLGHLAGDDVLRAIARTAAAVAHRTTDSTFRIAGGTFGVILRETDAVGTVAVAERLREAIMALRIEHPAGGANGILTATFGVTAISDGRDLSADDVRAMAERALDKARSLGRNRIASFTERHPELALHAV